MRGDATTRGAATSRRTTARRWRRAAPPTTTPSRSTPVAPSGAGAAEAAYPGLVSHPFPTCFACGTGREEGDGLRIFPGPVGGAAAVAATWTPHPSVAARLARVPRDHPRGRRSPVTWAALDCVGGWAADLGERPMVLGRMTARRRRRCRHRRGARGRRRGPRRDGPQDVHRPDALRRRRPAWSAAPSTSGSRSTRRPSPERPGTWMDRLDVAPVVAARRHLPGLRPQLRRQRRRRRRRPARHHLAAAATCATSASTRSGSRRSTPRRSTTTATTSPTTATSTRSSARSPTPTR